MINKFRHRFLVWFLRRAGLRLPDQVVSLIMQWSLSEVAGMYEELALGDKASFPKVRAHATHAEWLRLLVRAAKQEKE